MSDADLVYSFGLYVHGDQLDPDVATTVLGTSPTTSRPKGERKVVKDGVEKNLSAANRRLGSEH
jgi:hypothetical protein